MIYEDIIVSGSISISGSFSVPVHTSGSFATQVEGSVYHDSTDTTLKIFYSSAFVDVATQPAPATVDIEYLVVAGGGAGGRRSSSGTYYMGGGGAGGYLTSTLSSIASGTSITVTVGAGGAEYAGGSTFGFGSSGEDSSIESSAGTSFTTVTSNGGGRGATIDHPSSDAAVTDQNGAPGGSGGGASGWNNQAGTGGSGTVGQGNDGGNGVAGGDAAGAGGGGAGGAGTSNSGTGGRDGGNGGAGEQSSITGTATYYATGAGGGRGYSGTAGAEGTDGTGYRGTSNSGDGGQPGIPVRAYTNTAGHSGVVIFAYDPTIVSATGGTITTRSSDNFKVHTFTSSGTFTVSDPE